MKVFRHRILWVVLGAILVVPLVGQAQETLPQEQMKIESGDDLSPRAKTVLFRARGKQDDGDWAQAAADMTRWLADHPERDHHLLRFNLGVSLLSLDRTDEAQAALERAVELEPRFGRAWLRLGEAAYERQDYAVAARAFATGYDLTPDAPAELLYYSGVSWLNAGEHERATVALVGLLETHGDEAELAWYQALLAAATAAKQTAQVAPVLADLLQARAGEPEAWELAYRFAAADEDYRQAAIYLTIVGYLRPLSQGELEQLGNLYAVIDVPRQAARYYEQALVGDEGDFERLASTWMASHELDKARGVLQTALAKNPTADLWFLRGDLEYMAGDFAEAAKAFGQGCGLDPEDGRGWLMLGYCQLEAGDRASARSSLNRAGHFAEQKAAAESLLKNMD